MFNIRFIVSGDNSREYGCGLMVEEILEFHSIDTCFIG